MFPIRDDNPQILTPYTTYAIIALNALAWIFVQGLGSNPALAGSICQLGLIPGELLQTVPARNALPGGSEQHLRAGRCFGLAYDADINVPSRGLVPPHRQHVVPVDLRQ